MRRVYLDKNVLTALWERLDIIFREFDNIYVSFSGGKDSGLLLNLVMDFRKKHYPDRKVGIFHQDFEAQYSLTTEYVERTLTRFVSEAEEYWVCLPMATKTATSNYEMFWYPWDDKKEELWIRPMPKYPFVINLNNNPISTYRYKMYQEDLAKQFGRWYRMSHGDKKTVCLLGMRAEESLLRYSAFVNRKHGYKSTCWIRRQFKDVFSASPLYDWSTSDVWHANYEFGYDYNKLYDLYYMAGLKPDQMRVASPFNDYAKESLNLYRVIDPEIWIKLIGRVRGANFTAIYAKSKIMGYRDITLPEGHTWESYTRFLLSTLPKNIRNNYIRKFNTSMKFWHSVGGGLGEKTIRELEDHGYSIRRNGWSKHTLRRCYRVVFLDKIPDNTDDIKSSKDIPSWKRMCYCILKNDHQCRTMGFGITRDAQRRINYLKAKYNRVLEEND